MDRLVDGLVDSLVERLVDRFTVSSMFLKDQFGFAGTVPACWQA